MKRKIAMLLLSLVFAVTPATNVMADEVENVAGIDSNMIDTDVSLYSGGKFSVNVDKVDVRSGPGSTYSSYGKLYRNDSVTVLSIQKGWAKIKYKSKIGYISITCLKKDA